MSTHTAVTLLFSWSCRCSKSFFYFSKKTVADFPMRIFLNMWSHLNILCTGEVKQHYAKNNTPFAYIRSHVLEFIKPDNLPMNSADLILQFSS